MEIVCRNDQQIDEDALCEMHNDITMEMRRADYQQWLRGKYIKAQIEKAMLQNEPVSTHQMRVLRHLMVEYYFDRSGWIRKLMGECK